MLDRVTFKKELREKINNKEMFYDHFADKSSANKWNSDYKLKLVDDKLLPEFLIENKINAVHKSLIEDFLITRPRIAVLGLNPHAGDGGVIGKEEIEVINPAIKKTFETGKLVFGPYPADSYFSGRNMHNFDAVIAMYHDQGLIPFKSVDFHDGINFTAGLSLIRTSPDHGTAYDIAGKNEASITSFQAAVHEAILLHNNRLQHI